MVAATVPMWMMCDGQMGCDCPEKRHRMGFKRRVKNLPHGSRSLYQRGCRCAKCCKANTDYMREYMRKYRVRKKRDNLPVNNPDSEENT